MSLLLTDYPDPQGGAGETIPAAHLWIANVNMAFAGGGSAITAWVSRSEAAAATWESENAAGVPPADLLIFYPGEAGIPTMADLLAEPAFAAAFGTIRTRLYEAIRIARFPDAVEVP